MEFRVLGPFEVLDGDRAVDLPRGRARALLALLVLHAREAMASERLVDELWGESPPRTVSTALQGLVSNLRKRLEPSRAAGEAPQVLRTASPGYVLAVDPAAVDANRFRRLVEESSGGPASERSASLRRALGLWRGPALADFTYEPFAQREIAGLEELRLGVIEARIEADLALGMHGEVVVEAEALVAEHPFRERLRGQLMLALYRAGRQAEALEVYRDARRTLAEELGIEPGPALRQLEHAILRQDPSLYPESPRGTLAATTKPSEPVEIITVEPWLPEERRPVTIVFADLAASPGGDGIDSEALRRVVARSLDVGTDILREHGATVEELVGDLLVGIFGVPSAHEDDPLRAVRAALELRRAVSALSEEAELERGVRLPVRAGVETGEVVIATPGSGHATASGEAVNVAARLQYAAGEDEVLVGAATHRFLRDAALMEPVERPGPDGPGSSLAAWRLIDLAPDAPAVARRPEAPMVGRAAELARLRDAFERTARRRTAYRLTVLGDAGIGKSRLARELAASLGPDARILTGHCPSYGRGSTFRPLREIVLQAVGPRGSEGLADLLRGEDDGEWIAAQVAGAIGLTDRPGRPDLLFPAARRLFETLAGRGPIVVVLEDLHWAAPTFLGLIEYLGEGTRGPVLLLCLARPDLLEGRPMWAAGGRSADTLFLEPLGPAESEELIADRVAGAALPPETLARIVETAQGNPLFVEQMVAAFWEEGTVALPSSVHALLAARLDRLGPAERDLLRCAAVVGADFTLDALAALVPEGARRFVDRHLGILERKQLIRRAGAAGPIGSAGAAGRGFRFRHALIRLAAYRSMTRLDRAELHRRFAEWVEAEAREPQSELDEVLGYHLERAVEHRRALGMADEHDPGLAVRAGEHLARAGIRAFHGFDVTAAENLSSRAAALLPSGHPRRGEVLRVLAEGYQMLGRHDDADPALEELLMRARADGDRLQERAIRLERARIRLITGPDPTSQDAIREEAERALEVFSEAGDHARAAQASYVLGLIHLRRGATRRMEAVAREGLAHAERSGVPREEAALRWWVAWAVRAGETPVEEAVGVCEELARWGDTFHPGVLCELATLRAMVGGFDDARKLIACARNLMVERMRLRRPLVFAARSSAAVETLAGDLETAERELQTALELSLEFGERDQASKIAAWLSRVLSERGRPHEAERLAAVSGKHAPTESVAAQALWRAARALVMVGRDEHREAERVAREAVRLAPAEMPNLRADLLVDLADVLLARGEPEEASSAVGEAIEFYERKGNAVSAARAFDLTSLQTRITSRPGRST